LRSRDADQCGTKFDPSLVDTFLPLARSMHAEDFVPNRDEFESDDAVARYVGAKR
jgi:hypothetical protein